MSTVLHPVGPRRARVYWVRRLLVLVVLAALVLVATTAVSWVRGRGAEAGAAAAEATDPGTRAAADRAGDDDRDADDDAAGDAPERSPATPVDCRPEALQLTLTSGDVEYEETQSPVLTATVTNIGDVACTVDAGDATREVLITSGDDRIWSTKDCATPETASRQLLLDAGAADAVPIEWTRVRSAEGCPADLPAPQAGTYQAVATLGGTSSQTVVFILG